MPIDHELRELRKLYHAANKRAAELRRSWLWLRNLDALIDLCREIEMGADRANQIALEVQDAAGELLRPEKMAIERIDRRRLREMSEMVERVAQAITWALCVGKGKCDPEHCNCGAEGRVSARAAIEAFKYPPDDLLDRLEATLDNNGWNAMIDAALED